MRKILFIGLLSLLCQTVAGQKLISHLISPGEEIAFKNKNVTISGSLLLPNSPLQAKFPVFIFISGSGDGSYRSHFKEGAGYTFFKDLSDFMLKKGYAVLLLDKRGINKSEGNWRKCGFDTYADDIGLAIQYLKNRPEIDGKRIGILGHSQGGYIGQVAAAKYPKDVASFINLVGPAQNVYDQVLFDMGNQYHCSGITGGRATFKITTLKGSLKIVKGLSPIIKPIFLSHVIRHDPAEFIPKISVPVLSIFAENDIMVDEIENTRLMYKLAGNNKDLHSIHTIKGINHHFFSTELCYDWDTADKTIHPDLFTLMDNWMQTVNLDKGQANN